MTTPIESVSHTPKPQDSRLPLPATCVGYELVHRTSAPEVTK